ncbi:MAG: ATP-binding protein [Candidatus Binatia bacterium]
MSNLIAPTNEESAATPGVQYEEERRRLIRRRTGTACWLITALVPLTAVSDYLLYPHHAPVLVLMRLLSMALCVAIVILLRGSVGERFPYLVAYVLCIGVALANGALPVLLLGYAVPYYVAFIFIIFGVALLLPWRPSHGGALGVILLATYVAASLLHGQIASWPAFLCNVSFVGTAIGMAVVSMWAGEELRRREFVGRVALQEAYENKSRLATALADKTAKLESLNQEMEDLLYVASHDLRAPLINVQGFSRELQVGLEQVRQRNGRSPETSAALSDVDESLQFILTGVARLDALITSLLNVSRIATRTNPTQEVDLQPLAEKLGESFHYQLTEKGITLQLDPLPVVTGDPVRLGQLLGNLIDNAVKYMGNSPRRCIHVGARMVDGERRFFVRDTGPGIRKEEQGQIFRLFRRLANGDCPGEGIGLSMVQKIVEKHGGRIWVESTPGAGTTFWFTLQSSLPTSDIGGAQ